MKYEIIVVGGGHAGCEAALAASRKGHKTLLITGNIKNITKRRKSRNKRKYSRKLNYRKQYYKSSNNKK